LVKPIDDFSFLWPDSSHFSASDFWFCCSRLGLRQGALVLSLATARICAPLGPTAGVHGSSLGVAAVFLTCGAQLVRSSSRVVLSSQALVLICRELCSPQWIDSALVPARACWCVESLGSVSRLLALVANFVRPP
jgi:hypothetical protein